MQAASSLYSALATFVLFLHALFILWVVFGALVTRSRPVLRWLHIASLIWGILTELLPWPCPLTVLENYLEARAGVGPYQGRFLLDYLDRLIYPDISATVLTVPRLFLWIEIYKLSVQDFATWRIILTSQFDRAFNA